MKVLRLALFVACAVALAVGYGLSQLAWFQGWFENYAVVADSPAPRFIADLILILLIAGPCVDALQANRSTPEVDE